MKTTDKLSIFRFVATPHFPKGSSKMMILNNRRHLEIDIFSIKYVIFTRNATFINDRGENREKRCKNAKIDEIYWKKIKCPGNKIFRFQ